MTLGYLKNLQKHVSNMNAIYRRKHPNFDTEFGERMRRVMQAIAKETNVPQEKIISLPMKTELGKESWPLLQETRRWLDQILLA